MRVSTRRAAVATSALVVLSALTLSSCGPGAPPSEQGTPLTTAPQAGSSTPVAGISPLGNANLEMKTERVKPPARLLVSGIRTSKHAGFERVVFDLKGSGTPGWFIDYTDVPSQQGSGKPIQFEGGTALNVNIDGTVLPFEVSQPDTKLETVEGQGGFVTQVIPAGTLEGRTQFIIGLTETHPYSVQVLTDPARLVIDILEPTQK